MISALISALRDIPNEVLKATWNHNVFDGIEFFDGQLLDLNKGLI